VRRQIAAAHAAQKHEHGYVADRSPGFAAGEDMIAPAGFPHLF
jgi:hypothetical protein